MVSAVIQPSQTIRDSTSLARLVEALMLGAERAIVTAIPLGVWAAVKPHSWVDHMCRATVTVGAAFPTFFVALLAIVAVWKIRAARWWLGLGLVAWVLSLGPLLKVFDTPVKLMVGGYETYITLPWVLVYDLPGFNLARTPGRFNFLLALTVAVLAGYGVAWLFGVARTLPAGQNGISNDLKRRSQVAALAAAAQAIAPALGQRAHLAGGAGRPAGAAVGDVDLGVDAAAAAADLARGAGRHAAPGLAELAGEAGPASAPVMTAVHAVESSRCAGSSA